MSTQSGITPSQSLLTAFKEFVNNKDDISTSILIAHIENESIELTKVLSNNASLSQAFVQLQNELTDSTPRYIIIPKENASSGSGYHTFVSYVPDFSAVKEKMLYASSKNTLIRSLGSEYFNDIIFVNGMEEVNYENYKATVNDDISGATHAAAAGLSNREQELAKIKNDEMNTLLQTSTNSRRQLVTHQNDFSFKFNRNTELGDLEEGQLNSLNIDLQTEEVFLSNQQQITGIESLLTAISPDYPQFNVLKNKGKVFFIYSCPSGSKVKERMVYASNKQGVLNHLKNQGISVEKSLEVGDAVELELSELEPETVAAEGEDGSAASGTVKNLKFNRPSRPGRRTR